MNAGHLQECNKQLFEDQLRKVIVEAKEKVEKAKGRADSAVEKSGLDTHVQSSESNNAGATSQQVKPLFISFTFILIK